MKKVFYWSPCLTKVGTYKATINSALSLSKYSGSDFSINIINSCGEWNSEKVFFEENKISLVNLSFNYFKYLPKNGYLRSRFSYIFISLMSFIPLIKLLLKEKPDYIIIHLLTAMPLLINKIYKLKTKFILRISGYPKLNLIRRTFWKMSSAGLFKITCPSIDLKFQLENLKIFSKDKMIFLPDPILRLQKVKDTKNSYISKKKYFISVGRLTYQKNFSYLINEFSKFAEIYSDYDLHIYGSGEEEEILNNLIVKNNMENRIFLKGYKSNINFYMKNAQAFILSSLWEDPGFVLVEAAMNNLFLISSDCKNGPSEILDNGNRGYLFKNNEKNALFNSLKKFLDLNINQAEQKRIYLLKSKLYCKNYTLLNHFKILKSVLLSF